MSLTENSHIYLILKRTQSSLLNTQKGQAYLHQVIFVNELRQTTFTLLKFQNLSCPAVHVYETPNKDHVYKSDCILQSIVLEKLVTITTTYFEQNCHNKVN